MEDSARARWKVIQHLTELSSRVAAAQNTLAGAETAVQLAEVASGAADERLHQAQGDLDAAQAGQQQAREALAAARQARDQASTELQRLQQQARESSERAEGMS